MSQWIKLGVSIALIVVLAVAVDWSTVPSQLAQLSLAAALIAVAGYVIQLFVSAWKWQWALIVHRLQFPYGMLARVYLIGFFVNNFLPSSIGGDAYRVYRTMPAEGYRSRALSAVILERLVGLAVLMLLGVIVGALLWKGFAFARAFVLTIAAGAGALALGILALRTRALGDLWVRVRQHRWLDAVAHNLDLLRAARSAYIPLIAISLLFQVQAIAINYILFAGTGAEVSLAKCALITAVAGLATVVPLSINGIGVIEGAFAGTAIALGVDYEHALLVAILIRLLVLPLSLASGLLYAWDPKPDQLRIANRCT